MRKIQYEQIKSEIVKCMNIGEMATVYLLRDGRYLKIFNVTILNECKDECGIDIEKKILVSDKEKVPNEILKPEVAIYSGNVFCGFISSAAKGISHNVWEAKLTEEQRMDLSLYADVSSKLEKIVRYTPHIVYPDICTCDNIFIDENDGNKIQLIDYDGLQIRGNKAVAISTSLGEPMQYIMSKKYYRNGLFTKELDKKSLLILYFLVTFNVDLNKVGTLNPYTGLFVTLDDIFESINLTDVDVMHKVWKTFNNQVQNEWLGNDVFRLAEDYSMQIKPSSIKGLYIKSLVRK